MISAGEFDDILTALRNHPEPLNGPPVDDHIAWSETAGPPESAEDFALEAIYVICNSGMKHTIARRIYEIIKRAVLRGQPVLTEQRELMGLKKIFGHDGKAAAMDRIWRERQRLYEQFMTAYHSGPDIAVMFCAGLPWIGKVTKYHLAKNFGVDCAKPDVHLNRLAYHHSTTPQALCDELAAATGYRSRTIDLILWDGVREGRNQQR